MIARAATAQDDITGDGTTSVVLMVGELLKQANRYISEGLHPRIITDGYETAKSETLKVYTRDKLVNPLLMLCGNSSSIRSNFKERLIVNFFSPLHEHHFPLS